MNPSRLALLLVAFSSLFAAAQTQTPADPYKPVLDRLQAITTIPAEGLELAARRDGAL